MAHGVQSVLIIPHWLAVLVDRWLGDLAGHL
jgi:hypothetical protein